MLARPRAQCRLELKTTAGELKLHEAAHAPVLDALAQQPMTFDELLQAPQCAALDRPHLRQAVFALAATRSVAPALGAAGEAERRASCRRYNAAVLAHTAGAERGSTTLASPVLGSGIMISPLQRVFLASASEADALEHARRELAAGRLRRVKDGQAPPEDAVGVEALRTEVRGFFADTLPFYRSLGVPD